MPDDFEDWLRRFAWKVDRLAYEPRARKRFLNMTLDFWVKKAEVGHEYQDWNEKQRRHAEKGLNTPKGFERRKAQSDRWYNDPVAREKARPGADWVFEDYAYSLMEPGKTGYGPAVLLGVWFPPELAGESCPVVPEPFDYLESMYWDFIAGRIRYCGPKSKRVPKLNEKYAMLALIHDANCQGVEPIFDWMRVEADLFSSRIDKHKSRAQRSGEISAYVWHQYGNKAVFSNLTPRAKQPLRRFLRDVESDLRGKKLLSEMRAVRAKPSVPEREPLTDRQQSIWDELEGQARTAKQLGIRFGFKSDGGVAQEIAKMKLAGWIIENRRGRGYYRPDAPPK